MNRLHLFFRLLVNRHRKSTIRFLFSFLMSLLLLFLFSLVSFFRPYYFHQNEFMDEKVLTLAKEFDESPTDAALEKSDAFFEESIPGLGIEKGIVETKYSYCFTIDDVDLFFVSEDFSLLSLGLVPFDVVTAPKAKTAYAIGTESVSLSGLADLLGVDILWRKDPAEDNGQIVFPSYCALILNIADMDLAKVKADSFLTYCTLSLEGTLTDQEIYRLYMMSKAENLFPLAFDDFIYPARNYSLFYPVIQGLSGFKNIIYDHPEIYSVDAMAEAASMSRSSFLRRFKEEFGVNAGEWLKKRLCQNVAYACSNPENTIKDIVDKFNFSSPASFSRFCRLYFDCTPTELMARARTSRPPETFQL